MNVEFDCIFAHVSFTAALPSSTRANFKNPLLGEILSTQLHSDYQTCLNQSFEYLQLLYLISVSVPFLFHQELNQAFIY